jgi:hypothetical protein
MENSSSLLTFVRTSEEENHIVFKQMENMITAWKIFFITNTTCLKEGRFTFLLPHGGKSPNIVLGG